MMQERQDGWYYVWLDGGSKWYPGWWRNYDQQWISGVGIYEVPFLVKKIGPRIPSPDEPKDPDLLAVVACAKEYVETYGVGNPFLDEIRSALARLEDK